MDGERSASENLAKRAFFGSSQNLAISKPRLTKYPLLDLPNQDLRLTVSVANQRRRGEGETTTTD